jgi:lipid-A-disaccharide synthase
MAARVVTELGGPAFGLGGRELRAAGTDLVADVGSHAAMGLRAPIGNAPALIRALIELARAVRRRRPRAALLVGFSDVNARLSPWLKRRGVHVVWYAPPQVWAWRRRRAPHIARTVDHLALLLPFETDVWRRAGARADYVGHPALDRVPSPPSDSEPRFVALLPGSRKHEVTAHLPAMVGAVTARALAARVVLSPALPRATRDWARRIAAERGIAVASDPIERAIAGASAAIVSSGTATLECAALGIPPVIVYRTDPVTHFVAKRAIRVSSIGLPNLVLGRSAFPELVQSSVTAGRISHALGGILDDPTWHRRTCDEVRAALSKGLGTGTAAARVARIVEPWLC